MTPSGESDSLKTITWLTATKRGYVIVKLPEARLADGSEAIAIFTPAEADAFAHKLHQLARDARKEPPMTEGVDFRRADR